MLKFHFYKWPVLLVSLSLFNSMVFAQVTEQWVARYNGPGNALDRANDIVVDVKGDLYVTGESSLSGTNSDYTTIKYNSAGNQLWLKTYNGPGNANDVAGSIAVDDLRNVYITGSSIGIGSETDFATIKYDANGKELWTKRYNGPGNSFDGATALVLDDLGNIYVTGFITTKENGTDYATIKYDSNGNELWVTTYNGTANATDAAISIAVDALRNVYVTGRSTNNATASDYATIKYDVSGNELWVKTYNGPANTDDGARFIAADAVGNIYVTGSAAVYGTITDYATIKYDASGNILWVKTYDGPVRHQDLATHLAIDAFENVYVTGWSSGDRNLYDYATIKYDAYGNELWAKRYNGPANSVDVAQFVAIANGNIYVTGGSGDIGNDDDIVTINYDALGHELWVKRYDGPAHSFDVASAIAADANGNIYVTGLSEGIETGFDMTTIKYSQPSPLTADAGEDKTVHLGYGSNCVLLTAQPSGGNPPYSYVWSPGGGESSGITVCPSATTTYMVTVSDAAGYIVSDQVKVTVIYARCENNKVLVCHDRKKLCIATNAVESHLKHGDQLGTCPAPLIKNECSEWSLRVFNTPNPFSNTTRLQYELCESGRFVIKVFDGTGRQVSTLVNVKRKAGVYSIDSYGSNLHKGIYYYFAMLITDNKVFIKTGKMIKVK